MNGNNGNSNEGPKNKIPSSFGVVKNQGRNAFANETAQQSRNRSNAVFEAPGRTRSNALSEPASRNRANALFSAPENFGKIKNEGRQNKQPQNKHGFGLGEQVKNLGRAAFGKNPDRNNLSFTQKTGFNLMAGFMDKLISEAEKPNPQDSNQRPGFLKPPGNTGFNPNGENDNRRMSMQAQNNNHDDSNVTAGEFFKRLQTALQDPAKFKREALQKEQARANQQKNQPQNQQQQQRLQSSTPQQKQPTAQDFFKELRGALKDPAGYKSRVEAQQNQQQRSQQQKQPPGNPQPANKHQPEGQKANPLQSTAPKPRPKSPRK